MLVKYSFRDDCFYFDPADVPAEHYVGYDNGTKMYEYFYRTFPISLMWKCPGIDLAECDAWMFVELTESQILEMPFFTPIEN